jgi:hypothetical protein
VSKRAVDELSPARLNSWLRLCPWAVILDGLDEVPSSAARRELYLRIDTFIAQAEDVDVDPLLVLTTRRTGCDERLAKPWFEHLCLDLMAPPGRHALPSAERSARAWPGCKCPPTRRRPERLSVPAAAADSRPDPRRLRAG